MLRRPQRKLQEPVTRDEWAGWLSPPAPNLEGVITFVAGFPSQTLSYFCCGRLAGGMIPFMRRYSTICP